MIKIRTKFKQILSKLVPDNSRVRYLIYLGKFEQWRKSRSETFPLFDDRYKLYDYLNEKVIGSEPVGYLEFGVSKGESLKYWTEINNNPHSKFWGFDTFLGLPEKWEVFTTTVEKNSFTMNGNPPDIKDERITFVKGLFQETLPDFLKKFENSGRLVVHNDADLYSSTLYTLCRCNDILKPGTIVIFDEFTSVLHEFRAWEDYCSSFMREYIVIGATKSAHNYYSQIAVEMK
ncbi:MAG: TylF/MycF family methyltransferase [Acidobacteriota bacterium]|nr:TylF/MycF family methyltransferase [Acidobacteriota bacterium]